MATSADVPPALICKQDVAVARAGTHGRDATHPWIALLHGRALQWRREVIRSTIAAGYGDTKTSCVPAGTATAQPSASAVR